MAHPLYVAFIWHQHQPLYKSRISGRYLLPWVRLHGTKDYLDLILLLDRYPKLHQTVNLVPSLILQIEDYVAGTAFDPYLSATLTPTEQFTDQLRWFILEHFFDANHHTMIDPHPRYAQLYQQRQEKGILWCWQNWSPQDYSDLLAWHNLAWIDPLFWDDPDIDHWLKQGRNFSLSDRQRIYSKQREILSRILPQHRQMQESGQLEITTSPYTHPILPLLADANAGRVAVPHMQLPQTRFQYPEDIARHLGKAWQLYQDRFGCSPRGLWPSEQSVSPQILPYVAQQGFQWLCSDEAILGWSLNHFFHRDRHGQVKEPEMLYQPYRLETPQGDLAIVFRDHRLSDLIGFTYSGMAVDHAVRDLIDHLEGIAAYLTARQGDGTALNQPWLVTIALDGENCWEFYQRDGQLFLEHLYQQLSERPGLQLVTVSEYLNQFPLRVSLSVDRLHSGSWVDGSFTTWIGDPIKNKAWDLLNAARQALAAAPEATETSNPTAWEALYAAEGSDWFWWFGEGHSSNQDAIFDQLFREHLAALYQALQKPIPPELLQPLEEHKPRLEHRPESFIHPVINGLGDEQDWNNAGRISVGGSRGTMHRSSAVQQLWYGLDHLNFYLRFDFQQLNLLADQDAISELYLFWFYPDRTGYNSPIPLQNLPQQPPLNYLFRHHVEIQLQSGQVSLREAIENSQWQDREHQVQLGLDRCLELAVPWSNLPVQPDWSLRLIAVLSQAGNFKDYLPDNFLIPLQVP
uniref:Glycoside hydrolase family 57 n=1 Tax=Cyanothece sp. (strain PCC 7425 / ATCC 29141) TaxID=395961 RepID=B8HN99_CYAP4